MAQIDHQCCICEASFREGVLSKTGKCPSCAKEYPEAKTKLEALTKNRPDMLIEPELTEARVRQIIRQEINEMLAEDKKAKSHGHNQGGK